jgi:Uma2 family endonuclease
MLEENLLLSLPTEEDLPDSDDKPVDNELHTVIQALLRAILAYIWGDRFDWFFAVNLGLYPSPNEKAIGPDAFLSLGVERVRSDNKLRLSYLVYREKVMPQWVLEVVSKKPGGEYDEKFKRYAELGILYYVIYNPSHTRRDGHESFEVYRLESGEYIRQWGNPVWMPEIGLGIGHELGVQEGIRRDWLYWYNEQGERYLAPENALEQERILRRREQLMRREAEELLEQERIQRETESRSRLLAEQKLEQERIQAQENLVATTQSIALNMIRINLHVETISEVTGLTIAQVQALQAQIHNDR